MKMDKKIKNKALKRKMEEKAEKCKDCGSKKHSKHDNSGELEAEGE